MPRCGRHSFLGVFVVVLVWFFFRFAGVAGSSRPRRRAWCCVTVRCSSRSAAARLLWRFRAARRWWRSAAAPPLSVVGASRVPFRGLRWLAARWVVVRVSSAPRVFVVPPGRFVRRPSAFVPARGCSFAVRARSVFC